MKRQFGALSRDIDANKDALRARLEAQTGLKKTIEELRREIAVLRCVWSGVRDAEAGGAMGGGRLTACTPPSLTFAKGTSPCTLPPTQRSHQPPQRTHPREGRLDCGR